MALFLGLYIAFCGLLTGKAALDGGDDYYHISVAQEAPWSAIFRGFLSQQAPRDPLGAGVVNHALSSRVGQTLAIKLQHGIFESEPLPYFFVQIVFGGLSMVLLAWIVKALTDSTRWSVFAAFYYFLLPSALEHNLWLSDFAETVQLCILVTFISLYRLYKRRIVTKVRFGAPDALLITLSVFITLYALKSKSTAYVIPVMLAFTFVYALWHAGKGRRLLLAMGLLAVLGLLASPLLSQLRHAEIRLDRVFDMLLMNAKSGYETETSSAFFNLNSILPVSLARNIGFFFLWLAIFSSARLIWQRKARFRPEVLFVLVWLVVEISLFALVDSQIRYLTSAMLPAIILLTVLFSNTWRTLNAKTARTFFAIFFVAGILFLSINNLQHLVFLRNWKLGYFNELNKPTEIIYNDIALRPLDELLPASESVRFAHPEFVVDIRDKLFPDFLSRPRGRIAPPFLPDILAFSDIRDLHYKRYDSADTSRILKRFGKAYGISYSAREEEGFILLKSFRQVPYSPIVELLERFKKKKQTKHIFIYRIVPLA